MEKHKILKILALVCYLLIFFKGEMIAIPLGICLFGWLFDLSNIPQALCSFAALAGIIAMFVELRTKDRSKRLFVDLVAMLFLLLPIAARMMAIPLFLFNYVAFYLPAIGFIIFFLLSIAFSFQVQSGVDQAAP